MSPEKVADAVISEFNKLPASAKPCVRSNGVKEWTVLAGVVAAVDNNVYPLTIATGVKAMPDKVRQYSQGKIVHDLHAEILAVRLFNLFLLQECKKLTEDKSSKFVEKSGSGYQFKEEVKLMLYISEPPCGDASLSLISEGKEKWTETEPNKRQKVLRGRSFFGEVGRVRTKPGRSDSIMSLSKSCSDKLCAKQELGLTNALTAQLFHNNCYLSSIIVPHGNGKDFERCFKRIETTHPIKLEKCSQAFEFGKPKVSESYSPSPLSATAIIPSSTFQVLNNGVKNGSYIKNKPPKKGGESIVSNWSMVQMAKSLYLLTGNYQAFKTSLSARLKLKQEIRTTLENWVPTLKDDFEM